MRLLRIPATAALLLLAACANGSQPAAHARAPGHGGQQLTISQARQAFSAFLPQLVQLPVTYSPSEARLLTTDAELQAVLYFRSQPAGPPVALLTHEVFYVPLLTGYPRWFLAAGQQPSAGRPAGRVFVMVQSTPAAPWRAAIGLYDFGSSSGMLYQLASAVATDSAGYARAVPLSDPALVVAPSAMPATYARYLDAKTSPAVAGLFQHGPNTTGYISLDRQIARGAGRYGWQDTDHQAPAQLPVYALRLNTGGAIVIFSTYDTVTWRALSSSAAHPAHASQAESNYVPPTLIMDRLGITTVKAGTRISATAVDSILAGVQPKGVGFIYPLIFNGALTGASSRAS